MDGISPDMGRLFGQEYSSSRVRIYFAGAESYALDAEIMTTRNRRHPCLQRPYSLCEDQLLITSSRVCEDSTGPPLQIVPLVVYITRAKSTWFTCGDTWEEALTPETLTGK